MMYGFRLKQLCKVHFSQGTQLGICPILVAANLIGKQQNPFLSELAHQLWARLSYRKASAVDQQVLEHGGPPVPVPTLLH